MKKRFTDQKLHKNVIMHIKPIKINVKRYTINILRCQENYSFTKLPR